jgi:hypothetical protein
MSYLGNGSGEFSYSRTPIEFTATQGQTVFTTNYKVSQVEINRNGVRLGKDDFVATNGTTITLARGCAAGDLITVVPNTEVLTAGMYTKGEADALFAEPGAANAWSKTQTPVTATLTYATNIDWDMSSVQVARLTMAGNATMNAPTNIPPFTSFTIFVSQDATGNRSLAWNSAFRFPGGVAPVLTAYAGATDAFVFVTGSIGNIMMVGKSQDIK